MNLESKFEFIRVQYLALSYSSLCLKLSCEFCNGIPCELLYADDLVIIAETEDELKMKLIKWETNLKAKGLRVNMRKTKIMVNRVDLQTLKNSGKYPYSVCGKGVGSNGCLYWVHKTCSGITGRLKPHPDYHWSKCKGTTRTINERPYNKRLFLEDKKLDAVDSFRCFGDMIGAGGGCDLRVITWVRSA